MAKSQLVSGFTLAAARADLSERTQRAARERKLLADNVEAITLAMEVLKGIASKAIKSVTDKHDANAYGSIEADSYWKESKAVTARVVVEIKATSLDDMAWKKTIGAARFAGFDFGTDGAWSNGVVKCTDSWNAGLSAEGSKQVDGVVKARIVLKLRLKSAEEGATCERVQVGVKTKEVTEPVYELVCH